MNMNQQTIVGNKIDGKGSFSMKKCIIFYILSYIFTLIVLVIRNELGRSMCVHL